MSQNYSIMEIGEDRCGCNRDFGQYKNWAGKQESTGMNQRVEEKITWDAATGSNMMTDEQWSGAEQQQSSGFQALSDSAHLLISQTSLKVFQKVLTSFGIIFSYPANLKTQILMSI